MPKAAKSAGSKENSRAKKPKGVHDRLMEFFGVPISLKISSKKKKGDKKRRRITIKRKD